MDMYNSLLLRLRKSNGRLGQPKEGQREESLPAGNRIRIVCIGKILCGVGLYIIQLAPN